jgi:hypothetical protein
MRSCFVHRVVFVFLMLITAAAFGSVLSNADDSTKTTSTPRDCSSDLIKPDDPMGSAIRCAEKFVIDNGYTDRPADRSRLASESIERAESMEQLLSWRHNSLKLPAIGVCPKGELEDDWTVIFERPEPDNRDDTGRAVTMKADYTSLRMEHMEIGFEVLSDPSAGCKDLRK